MGWVSTCQKNCKTIDLRGAQVKEVDMQGGISYFVFWWQLVCFTSLMASLINESYVYSW